FRNSQADLHWATSAIGDTSIFLVKHDRVPSGQTRPSPSTSTRKSRQSLSQSVAAEITRSRFPEVSPLIHSLWRVRLTHVTYPDSSVFSYASELAKPTISSSPLALSCTTTGTSPSIFLKSISIIHSP